GFRCDPAEILIRSVPPGEACTLYESFHLIPPDTNKLLHLAGTLPFTDPDQAPFLRAIQKYWETEFEFEYFGSEIAFDSDFITTLNASCPSADQIQLRYPDNTAPFLVVLNTLPF